MLGDQGGASDVSAARPWPRVSYPARPRRDALPEWAGLPRRGLDSDTSIALAQFVSKEYASGRSLREIADLTGRTFSQVRNVLRAQGVPRRPSGAPRAELVQPQLSPTRRRTDA